MRSLIGFIFLLFIVSGCGWKTSQRPSFLIVAVEQLGADAFLCGEVDAEFAEGLGALCEDGVRFTHAYAPSTMSQPNLASILTGLYPKDNGVLHNGSHYLSEKFKTVAEVAVQKGYRTSFFSGGPPIWRKSGLDQGFELFEDNITPRIGEIFRPVSKNFDLFIDWLMSSRDGRPFFSVVYLPDLQFPQYTTVTDIGLERAKGVDGQLREVNESFAGLVARLKKMTVWDKTYVVLVGLNGNTLSLREGELDALNLRSDKTQILLMMKPARKLRDDGLSWSIDANVSLVDIGATLFDLLGDTENLSTQDQAFRAVSLRQSLTKPNVDWEKERQLYFESAWANWRGVGTTRLAVRQENFLYLHDEPFALYNSLTDRFETQPLRQQDVSAKAMYEKMSQLFQARALANWAGISSSLVQKVRLSSQMFRSDFNAEDIKIQISHLVRQRPWDRQIVGWLARISIKDGDWDWLYKLGVEHIYPEWSFVAQKIMGQDNALPPGGCWALLGQDQAKKSARSCEDPEFLAFVAWVRAKDSRSRSAAEDKFMKLYSRATLDEEIATLNFQNSLMWDTALDSPGEPRAAQLLLLLPEYKEYKKTVEQRIRPRGFK